MPVHAIRVEASKVASGVPVGTVVSNVVGTRTTVLPGEENPFSLHEPSEEEPLDEPYRAGLWRFPEDEDPDDLLDRFETALQGTAKWYRIRYHLCSRDLDPGDEDKFPCEWDDSKTRTGGPVPEELA